MAVLSKGAAAIIPACKRPCVLLLCAAILAVLPQETASFAYLSPEDLVSLCRTRCVIAMSEHWLEQTTEAQAHGRRLDFDLFAAYDAFKFEEGVVVGVMDFKSFVWPSGNRLETLEEGEEPPAVVFPQMKRDRTCLLPSAFSPHPLEPEGYVYRRADSETDFVNFINHHCNTYRARDGGLSIQGLHRQEILENFFTVKELPSSVTMSELVSRMKSAHDELVCLQNVGATGMCYAKENRMCYAGQSQSVHEGINMFHNVPQCERIPIPTRHTFFNEYLARSKPVVITGAMKDWPAISKWTMEYLREQYGDRTVHIKLTPHGEYEGIEPADMWEGDKNFFIPEYVKAQLAYPDLVVVRPATLNIKFSTFLDLVQNISNGKLNDMSAYLEYTGISEYFQELEDDLAEMPFFKNMLQLKHLNIWLSDGNTLGKTHFDPFDNFLCQISGEKEVILFEPHNNTQLYEAHIPEALLSFNANSRRFQRKKLLDSTSMVMSPVDIQNPDLQRFPRFGDTHPMSCTIREGDVLFLPAFWWHEVQSRPSQTKHRNLAVNFWYDPFLTKEFPCPDCQMDVNPKYRHLL